MLGIAAVRNARYALGGNSLRGALSLCDAFDGLTATTLRTMTTTATTTTTTTTTTAGGQTEGQTAETESTGETTGSQLFTVLHGERVAGPISVERKPVFAVVELAGTYVSRQHPRTLRVPEETPANRLPPRLASPAASRPPCPHRQYKVTPDDLIITEKLSGVDVNDKIRLNKVLLLGNKTETVIGRPAVEGASVVAVVEEQFLDGKVLVFKKRRRKNSRRLNGHRQPLTSLRVIDIEDS